uniref:Uncharacterized protein n=1 Tax=Candidatus Kentrum sp. SD TaxID=2126332 RepID=A0A450YTU2_9GAMM|nr:MAG: hypothetical protein BECKSD772F_GA0070984_12002 [Candidatus Kentron sp. SD]VFK49585.1 MAG: hypothetical protein BECKSD772E_GA0070983_11951 [Candidatus Kentron sp. SD]
MWLHVEENEIHHASHLIPTLDWPGESSDGSLGVRLVLEPSRISDAKTEELYKAYREAYESKDALERGRREGSEGNGTGLSLWPESMRDFLAKDKELRGHFTIRAYVLDPSKRDDETAQSLPPESEPLEGGVSRGLFAPSHKL